MHTPGPRRPHRPKPPQATVGDITSSKCDNWASFPALITGTFPYAPCFFDLRYQEVKLSSIQESYCIIAVSARRKSPQRLTPAFETRTRPNTRPPVRDTSVLVLYIGFTDNASTPVNWQGYEYYEYMGVCRIANNANYSPQHTMDHDNILAENDEYVGLATSPCY